MSYLTGIVLRLFLLLRYQLTINSVCVPVVQISSASTQICGEREPADIWDHAVCSDRIDFVPYVGQIRDRAGEGEHVDQRRDGLPKLEEQRHERVIEHELDSVEGSTHSRIFHDSGTSSRHAKSPSTIGSIPLRPSARVTNIRQRSYPINEYRIVQAGPNNHAGGEPGGCFKARYLSFVGSTLWPVSAVVLSDNDFGLLLPGCESKPVTVPAATGKPIARRGEVKKMGGKVKEGM